MLLMIPMSSTLTSSLLNCTLLSSDYSSSLSAFFVILFASSMEPLLHPGLCFDGCMYAIKQTWSTGTLTYTYQKSLKLPSFNIQWEKNKRAGDKSEPLEPNAYGAELQALYRPVRALKEETAEMGTKWYVKESLPPLRISSTCWNQKLFCKWHNGILLI